MAPRNAAEEPSLRSVDLPEAHAVPLVTRPPHNIVWRNVILMSALHLGGLYALTLIPKSHPMTWIWVLFYYVFSALGITAGAHRLWAHKSYKARAPLRGLLAFMNAAALQNDILDWSRDHRVHHKYSETDADPHNAKRGFFFAHVGWLLVRKHPDVMEKGKGLDFSDLYADQIVMLQRRFYRPLSLIMCFAVPSAVPWCFWGESLWNSYFLAAILRYCVLLNATWSVNSFAHLWGTRPYDKRINPAENLSVALSAVGEGFHNYHHTFPSDYATSEYGWYLNITTVFLNCMYYLGQAYDMKKTPARVVDMRKQRTGDGSF
ncbi:acyl-CoA desaturase-like isoform X1 [Ostrea edulis]|nr:acyl-CoA desaturase-like isoform X1 [Ostrea edulis]XP_056020334.1 acyl-CoA desaturase-like isoform X1 [Ostrea edulis]XP_056020335.1 acyl-CoA desaturase-like isoform X1 [Ostrea edulis]XP_056020336.1 acyl-CoA desaturase-like isoform X1 [Ostrea edulis]XP_056020337.1 acyl-CoA desaturase-like isoform X1 [Ostrea edulis]XP_056020339.1 acyl-CoA desaturase-like isoform X1 [Ostrea edulis]